MWQTKIKLSGRGRQWRLTKKIDPSMSAPLKIVGNGEPRDKRNRSPRLLIRFQQRGLLPRNSPMHGSALSWGEGLETSSDSLVPLLNNSLSPRDEPLRHRLLILLVTFKVAEVVQNKSASVVPSPTAKPDQSRCRCRRFQPPPTRGSDILGTARALNLTNVLKWQKKER